ncbi:MAG: hypothetical protein NTW16_19910 [Bacteroidetes bacterium]|nr:hypothetical protein [Bacteroidota bacterium]
MKTNSKKVAGTIGMIVFALSVFIAFSAFRAPAGNDKAQLVSDIRAYLDKNVKPIMQPQRVKLDRFLSPEEKKEIAQLNGRVRQLISKRNASGIGFITSGEFSFSQEPAFTPKQKNEQKESRDEMRRIMAKAWTIADNHEKEIQQLLVEKTSFFGTWERGLSLIMQNYLDDKFLFIGSKQIMKRIENRGIVQYYSPVAFLLWDPQQRFISEELIGK